MFRKILVAVDGSGHFDSAVAAAARLAACGGAKLTVCHAFYIPESYRADLGDELRAGMRQDAEDILAHAAAVAKEHGVAADTRLLEQPHAAEAVVALAESEGADLIVVGARGHSKDEAWTLSSVSETVARLAACSVLIVRRA
ncbi:MAG: universal stress protein [Candidatus Eisenbacteria bacterium]|nr:universal stress protein [Candidatus Eisenbacteria bacterium]